MKMRTQFGWSMYLCRNAAVFLKKVCDFVMFSAAVIGSFSCNSERLVSVSMEVSSMKVKWYILILLAERLIVEPVLFSAAGVSAEIGLF
jgi:hypothetical protein